MPQAGRDELVIMRLHGARVEGLEKLGGLFWRPGEQHAVLDGGRYRYRLVPDTSEDPMVVSVDRSLDDGVVFSELPAIHDITVEGASGQLDYDFYRVKLRAPPLRP